MERRGNDSFWQLKRNGKPTLLSAIFLILFLATFFAPLALLLLMIYTWKTTINILSSKTLSPLGTLLRKEQDAARTSLIVLEIIVTFGVLATFGFTFFAMLFCDNCTGSTSYNFWHMFIMMGSRFFLLPLGALILGLILYKHKRYTFSFVISLVGIVPSLLMALYVAHLF